jgi:hypothetical protein
MFFISFFFLPLDPDLDIQLNPDPIRFRIHNPCSKLSQPQMDHINVNILFNSKQFLVQVPKLVIDYCLGIPVFYARAIRYNFYQTLATELLKFAVSGFFYN